MMHTLLAYTLNALALVPAPQGLCIEHATLWVGDGTVHTDATLCWQGERITALGPNLTVDDGRLTLDGHGMIVTPGFIAAASSLGLEEVSLEDATRDTARAGDLIQAGHDAALALWPQSALVQVQATHGVTTAAVAPHGGLITGQVAWVDLRVREGELSVIPRMAVHAVLTRTGLGSRAAAHAKLAEVFADARLFARSGTRYDERRLRDLAASAHDLRALAPVVRGEVPFVIEAHRSSDIAALVHLAKREHLRLVVVGGTQALLVADLLAHAKVPVIVRPDANLPESFDALGARLDMAARLHERGVDVGIAMLGENHNLRNINEQVGFAIAYGLPAQVGLRAITLTLAQAYGMASDYGSLQVGKFANFSMWPRDPFEAGSAPKDVFIRGERIQHTSRQTLLRDRYLQRLGLRQ